MKFNFLDYVYLETSGYGCKHEDVGIQQLYDPKSVINPKYNFPDRHYAILSKDGSYKCIDNIKRLGVVSVQEFEKLMFSS